MLLFCCRGSILAISMILLCCRGSSRACSPCSPSPCTTTPGTATASFAPYTVSVLPIGKTMRFLKLVFFHQTTPPGAIRGSLEPFLILATLDGVIQVLKRLPASGTPGSCESPFSRTPGSRESPVSRTPGPGIRFLTIFKLQANLPSFGTPGNRKSPVSRTPGSQDSPVYRTQGSRFFFSIYCFLQTSTHCYIL